jgi:hypothetical protein
MADSEIDLQHIHSADLIKAKKAKEGKSLREINVLSLDQAADKKRLADEDPFID